MSLVIPSVSGSIAHLTSDISNHMFDKLLQQSGEEKRDQPAICVSAFYGDLPGPDDHCNLSCYEYMCVREENIQVIITLRESCFVSRPDPNVKDLKVAELKKYINHVVNVCKPAYFVCPCDVLDSQCGNNRTKLAIERSLCWAMESCKEITTTNQQQRTSNSQLLVPIIGKNKESVLEYYSKLNEKLKSENLLHSFAGFYFDSPILHDLNFLIDKKKETDGKIFAVTLGGNVSLSEIINHLQYGFDMVETNYAGVLASLGYASSFDLEVNEEEEATLVTGINPTKFDARNISLVADFTPLIKSCECFACTFHHRAYVRHLLDAHEILGETLLYAHNLFMLSKLFQVARRKKANGTLNKWIEKWKLAHGL